jgi:hypothetical protein
MLAILTTTLKSGTVVTAKQSAHGPEVYPITYTSRTQAEKAAAKLRGQGVVCELLTNRSGRTYYVAPTGGYEPGKPRDPALCQVGTGGIHGGTMSTAPQPKLASAPRQRWDEWAVKDNPTQRDAVGTARDICRFLEGLDAQEPFGMVHDRVVDLVEAARSRGVPEGYLSVHDEEIRAIDAPKPLLTAGVVGVWSGAADERGIRLQALNDINQWTEITFNQTEAKAYAIAARVWPQVQKAATLSEARRILSDAGARLHGWCAMD